MHVPPPQLVLRYKDGDRPVSRYAWPGLREDWYVEIKQFEHRMRCYMNRGVRWRTPAGLTDWKRVHDWSDVANLGSVVAEAREHAAAAGPAWPDPGPPDAVSTEPAEDAILQARLADGRDVPVTLLEGRWHTVRDMTGLYSVRTYHLVHTAFAGVQPRRGPSAEPSADLILFVHGDCDAALADAVVERRKATREEAVDLGYRLAEFARLPDRPGWWLINPAWGQVVFTPTTL